MKLKYYLRGLGIGICLTAFLLSYGNKEEMTEKEIIEKAQQLGMKMPEDTKDKLHNVLDQLNTTGTPKPTTATEPTITQAITMTPKPTKAPSPTPTTTVNQEKMISFTIEQGMSSSSVAKMLEKEGLIKDSEAFNFYIMNNKKANLILVGTYSLPQDSEFDIILKKITSRQ